MSATLIVSQVSTMSQLLRESGWDEYCCPSDMGWGYKQNSVQIPLLSPCSPCDGKATSLGLLSPPHLSSSPFFYFLKLLCYREPVTRVPYCHVSLRLPFCSHPVGHVGLCRVLELASSVVSPQFSRMALFPPTLHDGSYPEPQPNTISNFPFST